MLRIRCSSMLVVVCIGVTLINCSGHGDQGPVFKEIPELRAVKPEQPVKIKLKRNASGSYSWEVQGGNTEKIIKADRKLRDAIGE